MSPSFAVVRPLGLIMSGSRGNVPGCNSRRIFPRKGSLLDYRESKKDLLFSHFHPNYPKIGRLGEGGPEEHHRLRDLSENSIF